MSSIRSTSLAVLGFATTAFAFGNPSANHTCPDPSKTCKSFGVDFMSGQNYFQNIALNTDFNISSYFTGCQNDVAYVNLVLPNGSQIPCGQAQLTPDGSIQTNTCPIEQSQMSSGEYSLLLVSNNGDCAGLAAQRDFSISVGTQATYTATPEVVFTSTSTPVATVSTTDTITSEFYLPTGTVTSTKSVKGNATHVVTPHTTYTTVTTTLATKYLTYYDLLVANSIVTKTAHCKHTATPTADPSAYTSATTGAAVTAITSYANSSEPAAPTPYARRSVEDVLEAITNEDNFIAARHEHLDRIVKRSPEQATLTTIITDVNSFSYSTSTKTAPTFTTTTTDFTTSWTTSTPIPVTLYLNPVTTITLATPTGTRTRTVKFTTTWVTATKYTTVKIQTTVTPTAKAAKCSANGGFMQ